METRTLTAYRLVNRLNAHLARKCIFNKKVISCTVTSVAMTSALIAVPYHLVQEDINTPYLNKTRPNTPLITYFPNALIVN